MLYLLVVSILWALSFGLIKQNLAGTDSAVVAAIRLGLSLLVFLPFLRPRATSMRINATLAGLGAIQFGLMYVFYLAAFPYLKAGEVALFTIFTPLLVTLVDDIVELRVSWLFFAAALLAVMGTGICVSADLARPGLGYGFFLVQLSNACFAVGQVLYPRLMPSLKLKDREAMAMLYLGAVAVTLLIAARRYDAGDLAFTSRQWLVLAYLGVVASGLCFFLWNVGARRTNVGTLAVMNNAKIPLGMLAAAAVFGEAATTHWPRLIAGGLVIATALVLNELLLRRRKAAV